MLCMQYYDLRDEILTAKPSELEEHSETAIAKTKEAYDVNEPQAKAIISSVSSTGFTLIQGYVHWPHCEMPANIHPIVHRELEKQRRSLVSLVLCSVLPMILFRFRGFPNPPRKYLSKRSWSALPVTQLLTS